MPGPIFARLASGKPSPPPSKRSEPGEQTDALIDIALGERVHPRKGLELVIAQHGICRAITYFEQFPNLEDREACLILLVRTLHSELVANLKIAIARREGAAPDSQQHSLTDCRPRLALRRVRCLCRHLARDQRDPVRAGFSRIEDAIRLALELCEYGAHLSSQFKMRGEPPFEDIYRDHAIYLRALLGEDLDAAIGHFRPRSSLKTIRCGRFNRRRCWWDCWCATSATRKPCKSRSNI